MCPTAHQLLSKWDCKGVWEVGLNKILGTINI